MTEPYVIAHISELETKSSPEAPRWAPVRATFEIAAFGVNAFTSDQPDQEIIGEHDEVGPRAGRHEEVYFVSTGHAQFTVDGEDVDAPAGTFVFVRDPAAKRKAVAKVVGTTVVVAGGPRGKAFEPAQWERGAHALRHWETGDWEAAVADLSELHGRHPEDAGILYNLSCAESRAGKHDEALEHLRRSVELDSTFAPLARSDSDFEAIRNDPAFSAVAGKADADGSGP